MVPSEFPVRVYWEDTDAGGIVYHANYLKFFERARTEWLRARGIHQAALRARTGGVFVAADLHVRYLRPARLDDELIITTAVEDVRRAALVLAQGAVRRSGPAAATELVCSARVRIAWVDAGTLRPNRIPFDLLEKLHS